MAAISDLVRTLLAKRGVVDERDIEMFLAPDYERDVHDPMLLADMDVALARVFHAIEQGERIAIYADFDCDGVPGAALLAQLFRRISYPNVEVYIPHRDTEGYGFHLAAIDAFAARGVKLIITVDVGTVAFDACAYAKSLGVDVIVTDHHELQEKLPDAVAVLNPKRAPYPFGGLCGTGVAFKLACAILTEGRRRELESFASIPLGWEKWLLDLVAIATVADMVPLVGENRVLVHFGLRVLRKTPRPGLRALALSARVNLAQVTEEDIGFSIAPRVNAASRMDNPELAFRLLSTNDEREAGELAATLESLNASRKGIVASITKEARRRARDRFTDDDLVVVLGDPEWKPALLGLSCNAIVGERGGVAVLWGRDGNGNLKGSARSDGQLSVVELFTAARDALIEFGGHHASGGFSVSHEKVHELHERLSEAARSLSRDASAASAASHDADISLAGVSWGVLEDLSRIAPFGTGNPKPVFRIARVRVEEVKRFGKEKNHTEIILSSETSRASMRAFDFFVSPESFTHEPAAGSEADVLATIERDAFRGPARLALRLIDVLPASS